MDAQRTPESRVHSYIFHMDSILLVTFTGPYARPLALLDPQSGWLTLLGDGAFWNQD